MSFQFWQETVSDYEKLLESGKDINVIIYAGGSEEIKALRAHSNILCARSVYFNTALSNDWADIDDEGNYIIRKPNISPFLFTMILKFIYSGNIDLTDLEGLDILKLLIAVDELNIQTLITCLQEYLIQNKQEFLNQTPIGILEETYQSELFSDLWDFCLGKICEEPERLIESDRYTHLSANIMEVLFKRDDFYLDEIVIWENLIKWCLAQHPNVSHDVKSWNKEDINRIKLLLSRFINFIRFHHISSNDFYYKVLPYKKLLPKNLFHKIWEFHMVPDRVMEIDVFPRYSRLSQPDTVLMITRHFDMFASWIEKKESFHYNSRNNPYRFELLYRASRDGMSADAFHDKCDGNSMTIIVAKIKDSTKIVGGYNPDVWDNNQGFKDTSDSFIFSFKNRKYLQSAKVSHVNADSHGNAINIITPDVAFGAGVDLHCKLNAADGVMTWESHPHSYPKIDDIPNSFQVDEVECFVRR